MATLTINGQRIKVGDEFLSMTPEQQQASVEEIAASLGIDSQQESPSANVQQENRTGLVDKLSTYARGVTEGIPVIGPLSQRVSDFAISNVESLFSPESAQEIQAARDTRRAERDAANPMQKIGGNLLGGLASMGGVGLTSAGAKALGMTGTGVQKVANSALSGAGIAGADALARGEAPDEIGGDMAIGGVVSGAIPLAGSALRAAGRGISNAVRPVLASARNPQQEAAERIATRLLADRENVAVPVLSKADEATARLNSQPIMNIDRGGENVRDLARVATNMSPDAKAIIAKTADDRFVSQGVRMQNALRRITGKNFDSNLMQRLRDELNVQQVINPEYRRVFKLPSSQSVWNQDLQRLMQAPEIQRAISQVVPRSATRAALSGQMPVKNPFTQNPDGTWTLKRMKDGSIAVPTLEFWDQVKRNIDSQIDGALRGANPDRWLARDLRNLKARLTDTMDTLVPEYKTVRSARHGIFQAEDALEAGENFAKPSSRANLPEARVAFSEMNGAEKEAFRVGFISSLMRRLDTVNERVELMRQFKVPAFREQMRMVLGPAKARELEAFIRVEDIIDKTRGALGGSTTAMQLASMAAVGAGGGLALGADPMQGAGIGILLASGRAGARQLGRKLDERVLRAVAELLASQDPAAINKAISRAMASPPHMAALEAIQTGSGIASRAAVQSVALN